MTARKHSFPLDTFDLAILDILQHDNTVPQREIAERVNLSAPAVQRRIRKLQDAGVIATQVAVLEPARVGRPLTVIIEVRLAAELPQLTAALHQRIAREKAVQQCYSITGEADYLLIATLPSMEEFDGLVKRLFDGDANVRRYTTSVVLRRLKYGLQVPLQDD